MTPEEVRGLAEPLLRPALGDENVESVAVRDEDDWSGAASISIDVFVRPGTGWPDGTTLTRLRRSLSDRLVRAGDLRFFSIRIRDRHDEDGDIPSEAA